MMEYRFAIEGATVPVRVERRGEGYTVTLRGRAHEVTARRGAGAAMDLVVDGRAERVWVARDGDRVFVKIGEDDVLTLTHAAAGARPGAAQRGPRAPARLEASMHGRVVAVAVQAGDRVETGATVAVLEAMKMEIRLVAPFAGIVTSIDCRTGDIVERGRLLATIAPAADPSGPPPG